MFQQKSGLTVWSILAKYGIRSNSATWKKNGERMLTRRVTEKRCSSIIENNGYLVLQPKVVNGGIVASSLPPLQPILAE